MGHRRTENFPSCENRFRIIAEFRFRNLKNYLLISYAGFVATKSIDEIYISVLFPQLLRLKKCAILEESVLNASIGIYTYCHSYHFMNCPLSFVSKVIVAVLPVDALNVGALIL